MRSQAPHRRKIRDLSRLLLALACLLPAVPAHADLDATRILVIYNTDWTGDSDGDGVQDSLEVARYYATKRGIPSDHVVGIACSGDGQGYPTYDALYQFLIVPLKAALAGVGPGTVDVLLFTYGVPWAVTTPSSGGFQSIDNLLSGPGYLDPAGTSISFTLNPYMAGGCSFEPDKPHFTHAEGLAQTIGDFLLPCAPGGCPNEATAS